MEDFSYLFHSKERKTRFEKDQKVSVASGMLDLPIIMKTFLILRRLTTFTLDAQTFVQVFKDKKKSKAQEDIYGFCLLKLEWHGFNVVTLHLGFYMVNQRSKS